MWLEREHQDWRHNAAVAARPVSIEAGYRRGVLRTKVNVQQLTSHAATIDCMDTPPAQTLVWLTLPGIESRAAMVERCEGFRVTLRFTEPFHPAVLDAILSGQIRVYH